MTAMRINFRFLAVLLLNIRYAIAQVDGCPTNDLACHDIMNSSQCIAQLISDGSKTAITKEAMVRCVEYEGTASSLPGAVKVRLH